MKFEVKKYTVTILGQPYTVVSDESESDVIKASAAVNSLMTEIAHKAPHINNYDRAVLTALKLALSATTLEAEREKSNVILHNILKTIDDTTVSR